MPDAPAPKLTVLIVEDDPMISMLIAKILDLNGYSTRIARDGEEGLNALESEIPDIIMLDVNMPKMDGYEVCRRVRQDPRFEKIPVLMITGNADKQERIKGLEVGAEDFVLKPFNYDELLTRVLTTIKRAKKEIDAHPLTGLPGTSSIERALLFAVEQKKSFAALKVDLKGFKNYNERYGFGRGDEVIRSAARMIQSALIAGKDFLGHLGADDFFVLTEPARAEDICLKIIHNFDQIHSGYYDLEDSKNGFIETVDRQGLRRRYPLIGVAIGGVTDLGGQFSSQGMVQKLCDEVLALAKSKSGSAYLINRRLAVPEAPAKRPKKKKKS